MIYALTNNPMIKTIVLSITCNKNQYNVPLIKDQLKKTQSNCTIFFLKWNVEQEVPTLWVIMITRDDSVIIKKKKKTLVLQPAP